MSLSGRDRQVAKETVGPKEDCPHCNPGNPRQMQYLVEDRAFWEMRRTCAQIDLELAQENLDRIKDQELALTRHVTDG